MRSLARILAEGFAIVLVLAVIGSVLYLWLRRHDTDLPVYWKVPDFQLIADSGKPLSLSDLMGKVWVAEFFFASCAGICLEMNKNMMKVQKSFSDRPDFQIVSFTVDPQTDTPEILRLYRKNYDAIEGKWHFVTGDKKKIYRLARYGFKIAVSEVPPKEEGGPRDFIHSDRFILVDRFGRIRGFYNGTDAKDVQQLIQDIEKLL
ncbi:MAG: SCO family protein [Armatimonadetes bacterium]|nr:SCO family protein [Armatimonadota bacterium]MDW8121822.1 SCO family protein [Armatimonadota bacterium]